MKLLTLLSLLVFTQISQAKMKLDIASIDSQKNLTLETVFDGFGCTGKNVSPQIKWSGIPKETKSLALTVYDPDAPTGSGWWHWVVVNIPAGSTELAQGSGTKKGDALPPGTVQVRTDYNTVGYGGPCPPVGDKPHRYIFTLYALKVEKLPIESEIPAAMAGYMIKQNAIAQAEFTALYQRSR